jgi:hypothetical protein
MSSVDLIKHHSIEDDVRERRYSCTVTSTFRPLYLHSNAYVAHYIRGWLSPRAGLDKVEKTNLLFLPVIGIQFLTLILRSLKRT